MIHLLFIFEVTILVSYLVILYLLRVSLLVLCIEEADDLNDYDKEEEEDGPRDQYHDHTMCNVIIFQIEGCSRQVGPFVARSTWLR